MLPSLPIHVNSFLCALQNLYTITYFLHHQISGNIFGALVLFTSPQEARSSFAVSLR